MVSIYVFIVKKKNSEILVDDFYFLFYLEINWFLFMIYIVCLLMFFLLYYGNYSNYSGLFLVSFYFYDEVYDRVWDE